ncbi:hypothetical protein RRG08_040769 [Elysia crispata]|uniref:Uncharacterized protein n=1 Tax=Elysia crispata TaxID=231223 RepID=A0AAE1BDQ5_9GAST|nr:hypothetical protein RRG08_040769 [Elysia crispata]
MFLAYLMVFASNFENLVETKTLFFASKMSHFKLNDFLVIKRPGATESLPPKLGTKRKSELDLSPGQPRNTSSEMNYLGGDVLHGLRGAFIES